MARRSRGLEPQVAAAAGEHAARAIAATREFRAASVVALFAARVDEPATRPLFDLARARGIEVLMPRCRNDRTLDFFPVRTWGQLQPSRYGLLEPEEGPGALRLDDEELVGSLGVVVVPGVAFDRKGNRLGRGQGFYDRSLPVGNVPREALAATPTAALIGLAFEFQWVERVPVGPHDRRMDAVATEAGLWRVERRNGRDVAASGEGTE